MHSIFLIVFSNCDTHNLSQNRFKTSHFIMIIRIWLRNVCSFCHSYLCLSFCHVARWHKKRILFPVLALHYIKTFNVDHYLCVLLFFHTANIKMTQFFFIIDLINVIFDAIDFCFVTVNVVTNNFMMKCSNYFSLEQSIFFYSNWINHFDNHYFI